MIKDNNLMPFKTFGTKENTDYYNREGVYVIPIKNDKVCVVRTPKGYFLIGGGIAAGESEIDCLERECLEESGCKIKVFKKIAIAETYCEHPKVKHFHPIQHYYSGEISEKIQEPIEIDHELEWIDVDETKGKMFAPMQEWAIRIAYSQTINS